MAPSRRATHPTCCHPSIDICREHLLHPAGSDPLCWGPWLPAAEVPQGTMVPTEEFYPISVNEKCLEAEQFHFSSEEHSPTGISCCCCRYGTWRGRWSPGKSHCMELKCTSNSLGIIMHFPSQNGLLAKLLLKRAEQSTLFLFVF